MNNINLKPFPPHGKQVSEMLKKNLYKEIFLFLGKSAWKHAQGSMQNRLKIAFPDDIGNPQDYYWGFAKGLEILAYDTSGVGLEIIRRLARELLMAGATVVRVVLICYKLIVFRQGDDL